MTEVVIDRVVFDEIAELMGDSLSSFIETYLDNTPKLLKGLETALPTGDMDAAIYNAHQLKGGSGSIGAMDVFQLAKRIEDEARAGEADGLDKLLVELKRAYALVVTELKTHL